MRAIADMSVLITGAGSGIGAGVARWYVARGARVTIRGRRADEVLELETELGEGCRAVFDDVTVAADRVAAIATAAEHGGGLDGLVHCRGNMYRGAVTALDEQALLNVFHTNVVKQLRNAGQLHHC